MNDDLLRQALNFDIDDDDEREALIWVEDAIEEKKEDDSFYDGFEWDV